MISEAQGSKRPLLLSVLLVLTLMLAIGAAQEAMQDIAFFRNDVTPNTMVELTDLQRVAIDRALEHLLAVAAMHRTAGLGFAAAIIVVSTAMLAFAARAFSASTRAPALLSQLIMVQAMLILGHYVTMQPYRWAKRHLAITAAETQVMGRATTDAERTQGIETMKLVARALPPIQAGYIGLRSALCLLIVLGLRSRTVRSYYTATP